MRPPMRQMMKPDWFARVRRGNAFKGPYRRMSKPRAWLAVQVLRLQQWLHKGRA